MHCIYLLQNNVNYKIYIGQTKLDRFDERSREHLSNRLHNKHLTNAMNKYGTDKFTIQIIEILETQDEVNEAEDFWAQYFQTYNPQVGYNKAKCGGTQSGWHHSEETKQKLSETHKADKNPMFGKTGSEHHFFGKKHTEESKERMSKAAKDRGFSDSQKVAFDRTGKTPWNKGIPMTEELKEENKKRLKGLTWKIIDGKRVWMKQ